MGRKVRGGEKPLALHAARPLRAPSAYPVQHVGPALHGDTLEHGQHGEGKVVEVGDAVLGPVPPGLAHGPVLTLSPMACLQSTRGRILFCRNISTTKETGDGRRGGGVMMGREGRKDIREKSNRIRPTRAPTVAIVHFLVSALTWGLKP